MAYGDYGTYNGSGEGYASQADHNMVVDLKCPNCLGERNIDVNNRILICPFCDSRQILSDYEMEAYCRLKGITPPVKAAPPVNNVDYIPMREYIPTQQVYQPQPVSNNNNILLWILGFIFLPYVTVPLWVFKTNRIPKKTKMIIGAIIVFLIIVAASN